MINACKVKSFKGPGYSAVPDMFYKPEGVIQDGQPCLGPQGAPTKSEASKQKPKQSQQFENELEAV